MLFLIALVIAVSFSLICAPALRKKPLPFYIAAAVLSAAVVILSQYRIENELVQKYIIALFSKGAAATAFWCVVMFAGALPQKSSLRKRLIPSRGELSIFSALLTLSHIVTYAVIYIKRLLNPDFDPQTDFIVTCAVVILLLCIMIPLTIMSFKKVRGRMNNCRFNGSRYGNTNCVRDDCCTNNCNNSRCRSRNDHNDGNDHNNSRRD